MTAYADPIEPSSGYWTYETVVQQREVRKQASVRERSSIREENGSTIATYTTATRMMRIIESYGRVSRDDYVHGGDAPSNEGQVGAVESAALSSASSNANEPAGASAPQDSGDGAFEDQSEVEDISQAGIGDAPVFDGPVISVDGKPVSERSDSVIGAPEGKATLFAEPANMANGTIRIDLGAIPEGYEPKISVASAKSGSGKSALVYDISVSNAKGGEEHGAIVVQPLVYDPDAAREDGFSDEAEDNQLVVNEEEVSLKGDGAEEPADPGDGAAPEMDSYSVPAASGQSDTLTDEDSGQWQSVGGDAAQSMGGLDMGSAGFSGGMQAQPAGGLGASIPTTIFALIMFSAASLIGAGAIALKRFFIR